MSKYQQQVAILLICNTVLFAEFKTTWLGIAMLLCAAVFVVQMWRSES